MLYSNSTEDFADEMNDDYPFGFDENRLMNSYYPTPQTPSHDNSCHNNDNNLDDDLSRWHRIFDKIQVSIKFHRFNFYIFDLEFSKFCKFLCDANAKLPGQRSFPNLDMFRVSKQKKYRKRTNYRTSSKQAYRARRNQERDEYEFELANHNYWNQWKKTVYMAKYFLNEDDKPSKCPIQFELLQQHFTNIFSTPNDKTLESMPKIPTHDDIEVSIEDVERAINSMNLYAPPGEDRVLVRTIRDLKIADILKNIIDIILLTGCVPTMLKTGKTILVHKGGPVDEVYNWCPIIIYSVIRRIIERVLDRELQHQLHLFSYPSEFYTGSAQNHINTDMVNSCLDNATKTRSDCAMLLLDIPFAFEKIGHRHIESCLEFQGVSLNLRRAIMQLLVDNQTILTTCRAYRSKPISIRRSIPRLGPLSQTLFNLAINHVYLDVCDLHFANLHGYPLENSFDLICLTGSGDDQVVTAKSLDSAIQLAGAVNLNLRKVGLNIDIEESILINVQAGTITPITLNLDDKYYINGTDLDFRQELPRSQEFTFKLNSNQIA